MDYHVQDFKGEEVFRVYLVRWNKEKKKEDLMDLPPGWKRKFVPGEKLLQVIDYDPRRIMLMPTHRILYAAVKVLPSGKAAQWAKESAALLGHGNMTLRAIVVHKNKDVQELWMVDKRPWRSR